jgi:plasmid stabilization system protein ParE
MQYMRSVFFTPQAEIDLQEIYSFIAADNPFYAEDVCDRIHHSIDVLKTFPLIGTLFESDLRQIVEPRYRFKIVYRISHEDIEILAIFKYRENWRTFDIV